MKDRKHKDFLNRMKAIYLVCHQNEKKPNNKKPKNQQQKKKKTLGNS